MKKLRPTTQYKKDYKRFRNNPKKVEALKEVLLMLKNEQPIPARYHRIFFMVNIGDVWSVIFKAISC